MADTQYQCHCHMKNVQMVPAPDKSRKGTWKIKTLIVC